MLFKDGVDDDHGTIKSELENNSGRKEKEVPEETVSNDDINPFPRKRIVISDCDTEFYHCTSNEEHRAVAVVRHSNFDPAMKDSSKAVFLLNGKGPSISENFKSNLSPPPTLTGGNNGHSSRNNDIVTKELLEYGRLAQNKALSSVFVLDNVVLPLSRKGTLSSSSTTQGSNLRSSLHLTYAKKFVSRVCRFTEQHECGLRLDAFPEGFDIAMKGSNDSKGAVNNYSDIKVLEAAANQWILSISSVVKSEMNKPHLDSIKSPMEEVDFWRRRHVVLSDVLEQVKRIQITSSLEALRATGSPPLFQTTRTD